MSIEEVAQEVLRAHRRYFASESIERVSVDAGEQPPIACLLLARAGGETTAQESALALQLRHGARDVRRIQPELCGERRRCEGPEDFGMASHRGEHGSIPR